MKNIAIIPARSGSKGLPDKNIRPLDGKPLLAYSVEAALRSKLFDVVCVSTDSERYAEIGRACGAEVPFLRSAATSSDSAGSWDAVLEVLENYAKLGKTFDTVALLQPTSPLRDEDDIVGIYRFYAEKSAKGAVSVCETDHSPLWCDALPEDRSTRDFCKNRPKGPRQTLPVYYRFNGAIYVVDVEFLKKSQEITREGCYAYVMPKEKSVDVDDLFDFELAEWLSQRKKKLSR